MKKGFISKSYALTVIFSLLLSISLSINAQAEALGPGWHMVTAEPVSPEEAEAYYTEQAKVSPLGIEALATASAATTVTPDIAELARALKYDPKLIYDYVHNYIDYVPYYGSLKGATLTLLDGSGNDFDQASLMIALLRESKNYNTSIGTVQYIYGYMTIPGAELANWLGVDQNQQLIGNIIASGGSPATEITLYTNGTVKFRRIWVKANINGVNYLFDPAFKQYDYKSKIDIGQAMGYNQSDLMSSATSGANIGSDYTQNLNEINLGNKLSEYSSSLVNTIRSQYPNKEVKEIISGRSIIQTITAYTTTLPFSTTVSFYWDEIPTDDTKTAKLIIQHLNCGSGIDINYTFNTPDLAGKRLTITYVGGNYQPELRMDGVLIDAGASATNTKCDLYIKINHPYPGNSYNYADQDTTYKIEKGKSYAIVSNFGGVSDMLLQKRQEQLDIYLAQGLSQTSEEVLGETLNIMGITWLKELQMSKNILSSLAETVSISHHDIGLMAQESSYYIDVKLSNVSILSKHNIDADSLAHFKTMGLIGSAFEHGMLEQLMGSDNPGVSTMKLFQIANGNTTDNKVFYADSSNFSTGSNIKSQLVNYSSSDLTNFQTKVDNGYSLILPQDGKLRLNSWEGKGYISKKFSADGSMSMEMAIGGGYNGGFNSWDYVYVQPLQVSDISYVNLANTSNYDTIVLNPLPQTKPVPFGEPIDSASGAFLYDSTDLTLGGGAPLGLAFSRSYNSSQNLEKRTLGYGWTHNYDIYLSMTSHGEPVLGRRQPVDAASMITALYAMLDLLKTQDNIVGWMTASLSSKWAVDQTIYNQVTNVDNAVTVHLGNKVMEYIKLSDGTYSAPPGITTQLIKNGDNTYTLKERFGTQIDFNTNNKIAQLRDIDGNPMTFIYNADGLQTVTDAFNRTLTLNYAGGKLSSVSDSTGRSVLYGYTGDDLTSYTDLESKVWGYGYNDPNNPHRMTSLSNPLGVTTATNVYDSLGRVKEQTVPRQTGSAIYKFYFSGFRNLEEDPEGKTTVYYFDKKGRLTAEKNQFIVNEDEYSSKREYDGQNHITKVTDARGYSTSFQYDGNHNLTKITNALLKDTDNIYDLQFRLTDTIDPLNHGTFIDYDTEHHITLTKACNYSGTTCSPVIADDGNEIKTSATYRADGLPETATDARLTATTLTYDSYGSPYTAKTAAHPVITTAYNSKGWLTSLTDQVGTTTNFDQYNNRGQLKLKTDPLLKTTQLFYDNAGRLDYVIDRNNQMIDYSYTPTSKIDTITYPDASTVNFTYNNHDDLTGMQEALGTTNYTYNADHSLWTLTDPYSFVITYNKYDAAGNLEELIYPGNKKVIYTYDELNRLKTVKIDWLNQTATYNYDDAGRLISLTNFNDTITTFGYDNANRLTSLENKKSDTTTILSSYSFTLDGNGNRTQTVQNEPLTLTPNANAVSYTYNTTKNRLLTANTTSFNYDNEGQCIAKDGTAYTFDYEHRLKSIAGTTTFSYDGADNRLKAIRDGVETRYVYDASGNLLAEANSSNVITKYYIHGIGLMTMVTDTNNVYTYHFNAVGSTVVMTDSTQTIVNKYSYDEFGNIAANSIENVPQPFKFVGQYGVFTESNGIQKMGARYYDPEVGRFISEDPIGFDGGDVNLMAYVGNNPVLLVDPDGLIAPLLVFVGAKVAAVAIAYVGTKIAQGAANYLAGRNALSNQVVNDVFKKVVVASAVSAAVPAAKIGGAAAVRAATTVAITNPQAVQRAADFVEGALSPGPPPPSGAGYLGGGIRAAYDYLNESTSPSYSYGGK